MAMLERAASSLGVNTPPMEHFLKLWVWRRESSLRPQASTQPSGEASTDELVLLDAVIARVVPLENLTGALGVGALFRPRPLRVFSSTTNFSVVISAYNGAASGSDQWYWWPRRKELLALLNEIGRALESAETPWLQLEPHAPDFSAWLHVYGSKLDRVKQRDARFATLVIAAVAAETAERRGGTTVALDDTGLAAAVENLGDSRRKGHVTAALSARLRGLKTAQRSRLEAWAAGTVSFTTTPEPEVGE
jgi:hypothetical protein